MGSSFALKLSLSTSLQKLYDIVPIQHYSHFLNKVVWMAVQIMLTAESLLPACEWTAMHEKKDSYVFSMHGILPSLLYISNLRTMHKTTTKYCLNLPVILGAQALKLTL